MILGLHVLILALVLLFSVSSTAFQPDLRGSTASTTGITVGVSAKSISVPLHEQHIGEVDLGTTDIFSEVGNSDSASRQLGVVAEWELIHPNISGHACATPDLDYIVSFDEYYGYAYLSRDIGYTWTQLNAPPDHYRDCAITNDGQQVILVGILLLTGNTNDHVYMAYNGTYNFTRWSYPWPSQIQHVAMSENGTYIYAFYSNSMYKSDDGGDSFLYYTVHSGTVNGAACSANGKYVVYMGNEASTGYVMYSNDYGNTASWLDSSDSFNDNNCVIANNYGISMSVSGQYIITPWSSCRSEDYGASWERIHDLSGRVSATHINREGDKVILAEWTNSIGQPTANDFFPNFSDNYGVNYSFTDDAGVWVNFVSNRNFTLVCGTVEQIGFKCADVVFFEDTGAPSAVPTSSEPTQSPVTSVPSSRPSSMPSIVPSAEPSGQPSGIPTVVPTSSYPTSMPSTSFPSSGPSPMPSSIPSSAPSNVPSGVPSINPTGEPTAQPSGDPSGEPTTQPSSKPSSKPSANPSGEPTSLPTIIPSGEPSSFPSGEPSGEPSAEPSGKPSGQPSNQPTDQPSLQPSAQPSGEPTGQPSGQPTKQPSDQPSGQPTKQPSSQPSSQPSLQPSLQPSGQPSSQPTSQPSPAPTPVIFINTDAFIYTMTASCFMCCGCCFLLILCLKRRKKKETIEEEIYKMVTKEVITECVQQIHANGIESTDFVQEMSNKDSDLDGRQQSTSSGLKLKPIDRSAAYYASSVAVVDEENL